MDPNNVLEGHFTNTTNVDPQSSYGSHVRHVSDQTLPIPTKTVLSVHNSKSIQAILEALNLLFDVV